VPSFTHDGLARTYVLYPPDARAGDEPRPLLIALHGGRANGRQMAVLTRRGFNKLADRDGFLVAYPDGHTMHWSDGSEPQDRLEGDEDADDVGFLAALTDELVGESEVDPKRVYVAGISNGALMAIRFAMERAEKVAAIASVAGAVPRALAGGPGPSMPVPALFIHGTDDKSVAWDGGTVRFMGRRFGSIISVPDSVRYWVDHNGCSKEPETSVLPAPDPDDGTRVRREVYLGGRECSAVELWRIEGGGHTWPGGRQYFGEDVVGRTSRAVDACEVIWEFFKGHARE